MKYLNFLFAVLLFFSCSDDKKWELIGSRILDSDDNPILCESFSVSQNAGKFAFTEREEYSSHTYLSTMNIDGTDHQKSSIEGSNAVWSHDGSLLY